MRKIPRKTRRIGSYNKAYKRGLYPLHSKRKKKLVELSTNTTKQESH